MAQTLTLRPSKRLYPLESLQAAAAALEGKVRASFRKGTARAHCVNLRGCGGRLPLRKLAGEFLNEALSHQHRQELIRLQRGLTQPVLARLLAQGFHAVPKDPLEQMEPQVKEDRARETRALLAQARGMSRKR